MGPDEEKRLRQLLSMKQQLPEPDWNLFARTSKRFSRLSPEFHKIETQQKSQMKKPRIKQNAKTLTRRKERQGGQEMESRVSNGERKN